VSLRENSLVAAYQRDESEQSTFEGSREVTIVMAMTQIHRQTIFYRMKYYSRC